MLTKEIIIFILSFSLLTFVIFLMQNHQIITIHPHLTWFWPVFLIFRPYKLNWSRVKATQLDPQNIVQKQANQLDQQNIVSKQAIQLDPQNILSKQASRLDPQNIVPKQATQLDPQIIVPK